MRRVALCVAGTLFMALSLNVFLEPSGLVTGGAAGLGVIAAHLSEKFLPYKIPLWFTNIAVNVPLVIWAYKTLGRAFTLRTFAAALLLSVFLKLTSALPMLCENDDFINAVFGGSLMGAGVGAVLLGGATTGGSDLLAALIHSKNGTLRISVLIFAIDIAVLLGGAFVFGAVKTMYSAVSVYAASAAVKLVSEGAGFARVVFIMSDKYKQIAEGLTNGIKRGATVLYGEGAYTGMPKNTVMAVAANREIPAIKRICADIDPQCFMFVSDVREVLGEFRKRENIRESLK